MAKTYIDERGYARFKDTDMLVHRYVAEKKENRKLRNGEVVHHIDRNKLNNHPDNLYVFRNQAEHDRIHKIDARRHGKTASYQGFDKARKDQGGCMLYIVILISISSLTYFFI